MQLHLKFTNRSTVTFDDPQDVNALREMATLIMELLHDEVRRDGPPNWRRVRAYRVAMAILDQVPEQA